METIIRVIKDLNADPFVRIDKKPLYDPKLSYKAKGILAYVLSKPDNWETNIIDLTNHATDKDKAVRSGINELVQLKYCRKVKLVDPVTMQIKKWIYIFYERAYKGKIKGIEIIKSDPDIEPLTDNRQMAEPLTGFPLVEKPLVEKPLVEKGPPINKCINKQMNQITNKANTTSSSNVIKGGNHKFAAAEIPEKQKKEYSKIKKRLQKFRYRGSQKEIQGYFIQDPDYLLAWMDQIENATGIKNPAGLLLSCLRSGEWPMTNKEIERQNLLDLGIPEEELDNYI